MKLVFPQGEQKDFELIGDSFTLGSSEDADITIDVVGLNPIHATLINDDGNFTLKVASESSMASVNGKLVKGEKEVREGDLMIISQVHCKLEGKQEEAEDDNRTRIRMALPQFILRGVSGVYFGKTFPLRGSTSLGRHSENDIFVNVDGISRKHAVISITADGLVIEDQGSSNGTFVNGKQIKKESIKIGDEIKLDNIRFLIQSPGMKQPGTEAKPATPNNPSPSVTSTGTIEEPSSGAGKWIITALVLVGAAVGGAYYLGLLDQFIK